MRRVICDQTKRPAFDANESGNHTDAIARAHFQHTARIGNQADGFAHVISALAVFGNDVAQQTLIGAFVVAHAALKKSEQFFCHRHGVGFVFGQQVDNAIGKLYVGRPNFRRGHHAEPAALDHRRPAHADIARFGRDGDIGATKQHRIAGKAIAIIDRDARRHAAGFGKGGKGHDIQRRALHFGKIRVARTPAPAFGEKHNRCLPVLRQFQHAVGFFVVKRPLRTGQNRIVISQYRCARLIFGKFIAIDRAETGNQAVGGRVVNQIVKFAPLTLGGNHQLTIFDKAVWVA